jgi:hypothetical protein
VQRLQKKSKQQSFDDDKVQSQDSSTQLSFYPPAWRDVLESAKAKFRLYLTNVKSFPTREEGVAEVSDRILEVLSQRRDAGKKVEHGM